MKNLLATIAIALALGGCGAATPNQANESAGPAFQSPYCASHANEPRCMN
ncbi:MAG: hypothetical protein K8S22_21215 [Betaproteobacteria bacterium]|nr:hypothetical protein [Betaproteobacteria bacterium]